jgi:hypothetical protein
MSYTITVRGKRDDQEYIQLKKQRGSGDTVLL